MRVLKFFIILAVVITAITLCDGQAFKQDHESAMAIAKRIQQDCLNNSKCVLDLDKVGVDAGNLNALPKLFEYRVRQDRLAFVVSYKGTSDPDCGYVIYGGSVRSELQKDMLCEQSAFQRMREDYQSPQKLLEDEKKSLQAESGLAGTWSYGDGVGTAKITVEENNIQISMNWAESAHPGPHYQLNLVREGNELSGTWNCVIPNETGCGIEVPITLVFDPELQTLAYLEGEANGHGFQPGLVLRRVNEDTVQQDL